MSDVFNLILVMVVGAVFLFIIKAVRQIKSDMDRRLRGVDPAKRKEFAEKLAGQIRDRDIKCTRCGKQSFALLGTGNQYKCHTCNFEFEGPAHFPDLIDGPGYTSDVM